MDFYFARIGCVSLHECGTEPIRYLSYVLENLRRIPISDWGERGRPGTAWSRCGPVEAVIIAGPPFYDPVNRYAAYVGYTAVRPVRPDKYVRRTGVI